MCFEKRERIRDQSQSGANDRLREPEAQSIGVRETKFLLGNGFRIGVDIDIFTLRTGKKVENFIFANNCIKEVLGVMKMDVERLIDNLKTLGRKGRYKGL